MEIPSRLKFADDGLRDSFDSLSTGKQDEQQLQLWLRRAFEDIEKNAFCGIQIPKNLIPEEYLRDYEVTNLWKYNLPNAWRLLYTIKNVQVFVVSIVLEWMDHKNYERRFNY